MELSYHRAGKKKREPFSAGGEEPIRGDLKLPGQVKGPPVSQKFPGKCPFAWQVRHQICYMGYPEDACIRGADGGYSGGSAGRRSGRWGRDTMNFSGEMGQLCRRAIVYLRMENGDSCGLRAGRKRDKVPFPAGRQRENASPEQTDFVPLGQQEGEKAGKKS